MEIKIFNRTNAVKESYRELKKSKVIISISDPDKSRANFNRENKSIKAKLYLSFYDIDEKTKDIFKPYEMMSRRDANKIVDFVCYWQDKVDEIWVNCEAGVSRSAGIAAAIMESFYQDSSVIFDDTRYLPNMYCYRLTKNAFDRIDYLERDRKLDITGRNKDQRVLSKEEIDEKLRQHELWLEDETNPKGARADFSQTNLKGYDFSGRDLSGASFYEAYLGKANFSNCILYDTVFINSHLDGASFKNASLFCSCFGYVKMIGADFSGASADECGFYNAYARSCNFEGADLPDSTFICADLFGCNFKNTYLSETDFFLANLDRADFSGAYGYYTDFRNADNIEYANFENTDFKYAKFGSVPQAEKTDEKETTENEKKP